jgi:predicted dehydrogenase
MTPEKPVNFAIIGCGTIAKRHAGHIARLGNLVAVCDIEKDRADAFAEEYGARAFYSVDDMLASVSVVDVVSVCSPNGLHAEHTIASLRAGYHVLCEKPMALSVLDCERMIAESRKADRKLFIVKQNRYNPPVIEVKELIRSGKLGKILGAQVNCFWNRDEAYYRGSPWRGTKNIDGGVLYTQFSHFIDLLHWFLGDINDLHAFVGNSNHPSIEIEDHGAAIFRFQNGAVGTLKFTINSYRKNMEGSITIFGEKGTVKIGGQYLNTLEYVSIEGYEPPTLPKGNGANDYGAYQGSMSNHDKVYENVIDVLKNGGTINATGDDGWRTVETISRIYRSAGWMR